MKKQKNKHKQGFDISNITISINPPNISAGREETQGRDYAISFHSSRLLKNEEINNVLDVIKNHLIVNI